MDTTMTSSNVRTRRPLAALGKLTLAALVGMALAVVFIMVAMGGSVDMIGLAFSTLPLIFAGLMLTGWRWTPALGTLIGGLLLVMVAPMISFILADPGGPMFAPLLLILALASVAVAAGIGATVQNYRRPAAERRAPRWLAALLVGLAGLLVGAISVGTIPRASATTGVSPEVLAQLPSLSAKNYEFNQKEIRVKAGQTVALRLENGDAETHYFDIDELNVHAPIPAGQNGLALFKPTKPGRYTFYCKPHSDKATGQGMVGTLIIEP
jgi:cytochrome c oxidase subunit II